MTNLRVYQPWNRLAKLHSEINRAFQNPWFDDNDADDVSQWLPAVDIIEEKERFLLHIDVPGVDINNIEISMAEGLLMIKGHRQSEHQEKSEHYRRIERSYGDFYRRFSLPDTADGEKITAKSNNGVLEIIIPKRERAVQRRIAIEQ